MVQNPWRDPFEVLGLHPGWCPPTACTGLHWVVVVVLSKATQALPPTVALQAPPAQPQQLRKPRKRPPPAPASSAAATLSV